MKQLTVKRAVEAWYWIANNEHFEVGTEYSKNRKDDEGRPAVVAIFFRNHHEKMRVPDSLRREVFAGIKPNRRAFDTRMFSLTKAAKLRIAK